MNIDIDISVTRSNNNISPALLTAYKNLCAEIFTRAGVWAKKISVLPTKHAGSAHRQGLSGARVLSTAPNLIHLVIQPNGNDTCREVRIVPPNRSDIAGFKKRIEDALSGPAARTLDEIALEMQTQEHALAALDLIIEQMRDVSIVSGLGKSIVELRVPSFVGVLTSDEMSALIELLTECGAVKLKTCGKKPGEPCWQINSEVLLDLHEKLSRLEKAPEVVDEDEDDTADALGDVMCAGDDDAASIEPAPQHTPEAPANHEEQKEETVMTVVPEKSLEALTKAITLKRAELKQHNAQIDEIEKHLNALKQQGQQKAANLEKMQAEAQEQLEKIRKEIEGE